jgi:ABC-type transport system substrate-binding protein
VQFVNPSPTIVTDLRFRQAMLQATDRQQLADFVFSGQAAMAHSYVNPEIPLYNLVEPNVVRYAYDPGRAAQLIEELGYTRRSEGFAGPGGQRLEVAVYTPTTNDIQPKALAALADQWQRVGVAVEQVLIPPQRAQDREYRAQFPAFELAERPNRLTASDMRRFHSSQAPLPENRFRATGNVSRYQHPELDGLIERYAATIPLPERMQVLGGIVHHMTMYLPHLPVFFGADPTMISNRLINVTARGDTFTQAWNVQDWDVQG